MNDAMGIINKTSSIGNRLEPTIPVSAETEQALGMLSGVSTCIINDAMNRLYGMNSTIKLLNPDNAGQMLGTAITVKTAPGDTLRFHQAVCQFTQKSSVIVVDGFALDNRAVGGEIVLKYAQLNGIAGVVVNGLLRDYEAIKNLQMPVYAIGTTNIGPWKMGPGEINVPVSCGGQVVRPGDIVVGDKDGVVVIPYERALEVCDVSRKKKEFEDKLVNLADNNAESFLERVEHATIGYLSELQ